MLTAASLGLHDLYAHRRMTLVMAAVIAIAVLLYLLLYGYWQGVKLRYPRAAWPYLVVQQEGSLGEFYGSRLSLGSETQLIAAGVTQLIPEIHTIIGTSHSDAILLRGVPVDNYSLIEDFHILAGRPLLPDDPPRLTMIGVQLADTQQISPGSTLRIRGRDFTVAGVFETGSYADFEAWIPIEEAQSLLGWGQDVSVYIIPDEGIFEVGERLPGGVVVVQKGESNNNLVKEWAPLINLLSGVAYGLALAAGISLANVLWRLAWLRRRQLAILRAVGFGRSALTAYLFSQGAVTAALGYLLGLIGALVAGAAFRISTAGISITPVFGVSVIVTSLAFAGLITCLGTILPAWWLNRLNLAHLLQVE